MSTGAVVLLVAVLIFFVFEAGSLIATVVKKRKASKRKQALDSLELIETKVGVVAEDKSNEEVNDE